MGDTDETPDAARLEACLALLLGATSEEELADAKAQAKRVMAMTDEDVRALGAPTPAPSPNAYARLSRRALSHGDPASAHIYARQAEQYARRPKEAKGQTHIQWEEDKHPRDHGQFAPKGGGRGGAGGEGVAKAKPDAATKPPAKPNIPKQVLRERAEREARVAAVAAKMKKGFGIDAGEFQEAAKGGDRTWGENATELLAHAPGMGAVKTHGMAEAEEMRAATIGGVRFLFGADDPKAGESVLAASDFFSAMPAKLRDATDQVVLTAQANKYDAYWGGKYDLPGFESAATGGDGGITIYNGRAASMYVLAHESGHNLAKKLWGDTFPPPDSDFAVAAAGESKVSEYARSSTAEGFAEAVRVYVESPAVLEKHHPRKFAALKAILEG